MWKEFTRERPARRGWTMATLALAFIGTVVLAKIMVDERANNPAAVSGEQSPPDWPFAFALPTDHRWRLRPDSYGGDGAEELVGDTASFDGRRPSGGFGLLLITFHGMSPETPPSEVASELAGEDVVGGEKISIGPIKGLLTETLSPTGGAHAMAFGCSDEGLAILVAYVTTRRTGEEKAIVRSVCDSIEFKEWRSRR